MKSKFRPHLAKLQTQARPVVCIECGKKCMIVGTATKKLCEACRHEWNAKKGDTRKNRVLPSVRASNHTPDRRPIELVSVPPAETQQNEDAREKNEVARQETRNGIRYAGFREAVTLITRAEREEREGVRHGWLGTTGSGKTTSLKTFLAQPYDGLTMIHDDTKIDAQYPGAVVLSLREAPEDAHTLVFRGDVYNGTVVDPEYVASLGLEIAKAARVPIRVVVDEISRACSKGGMVLDSPSVKTCLTQGRALGLSFFWSNQSPMVPRELIDQSSTIAIHQLGPRALNYLDDRLMFDREILDVVPNLKQGEFVISEQGKGWNKTIYRTPAPSRDFDHRRYHGSES